MEAWEKASGPFRKLTQEFKEVAERLPYVDAFWIHASRAAGRQRKDSDIDYAFLVKQKQHEPRLHGELFRFLRIDRVPGWYPEEAWGLARWKGRKLAFGNYVSPHIFTTREVFAIARNLFSMRPVRVPNVRWLEPFQTTYFLRHQGTAQWLIVESVPVHDPRAYLPRLREMVSAYPDSLSRRLVSDFVQRLRVKLIWYGDRWVPTNKAHFMLAMHDILHYIAVAHHAKNKRFLLEGGLRRWHVDLLTMKPDLRSDLDRLLAIDGQFGRENKSVYLRRIIEKLAA